jgi:hypothetical protein
MKYVYLLLNDMHHADMIKIVLLCVGLIVVYESIMPKM